MSNTSFCFEAAGCLLQQHSTAYPDSSTMFLAQTADGESETKKHSLANISAGHPSRGGCGHSLGYKQQWPSFGKGVASKMTDVDKLDMQ